jgi:hypothetical protein
MTLDGMDPKPGDETDLSIEVSDQETARGGLMQRFPTEDSASYRAGFWKHRNVYDGNGEYELPTASHYVPQYWQS